MSGQLWLTWCRCLLGRQLVGFCRETKGHVQFNLLWRLPIERPPMHSPSVPPMRTWFEGRFRCSEFAFWPGLGQGSLIMDAVGTQYPQERSGLPSGTRVCLFRVPPKWLRFSLWFATKTRQIGFSQQKQQPHQLVNTNSFDCLQVATRFAFATRWLSREKHQ